MQNAAQTTLKYHIKFAADTAVVRLIIDDSEWAYRREMNQLVSWCKTNNLSMDVDKTKEITVDLQEEPG